MELRQLTYVEAVARHGHFTRAAEELLVAQPAVSAQIRKLEAELGVELFHRTTRRVTLTRAGEVFLTRARRALDELAAARTDLDRLAGVLRGRVVLGAVQSLDPLDLPGCLAGFHAQHPAVRVVLGTGNLRRMVGAVRSGDFDLALTPVPADLPEDVLARELFTDELVVVLPPDHPLAGRPRLALAAIADEPFVAMPPTSDLRQVLIRLATEAGFTPRVQFETTDVRRIRELVAHGLGVTLLARSTTAAPGPAVAVLPIAPRPPHRVLCLISRRHRRTPPAVQAFARFLTDWADRQAAATTDNAPGTHSTATGSGDRGSPSA